MHTSHGVYHLWLIDFAGEKKKIGTYRRSNYFRKSHLRLEHDTAGEITKSLDDSSWRKNTFAREYKKTMLIRRIPK